MPCTCHQPVRPEFKDSYKDLLDKPKINGVPLSGNLTSADLGIKAGAQFKIVQQLPITDIDEATVYLVPVQVGQTDNIYQEWIYINNRWEKIGEPISVQGGGNVVMLNKRVYLKEGEPFYDITTLSNLNKYAVGFQFADNTVYKITVIPTQLIFYTLLIQDSPETVGVRMLYNIPSESDGSDTFEVGSEGGEVLLAQEIIISNGMVTIGGLRGLVTSYYPGYE